MYRAIHERSGAVERRIFKPRDGCVFIGTADECGAGVLLFCDNSESNANGRGVCYGQTGSGIVFNKHRIVFAELLSDVAEKPGAGSLGTRREHDGRRASVDAGCGGSETGHERDHGDAEIQRTDGLCDVDGKEPCV